MAIMFNARIRFDARTFRIEVEDGKGGNRSLWFDLTKTGSAGLSNLEARILRERTNGPIERVETVRISRDELVVLKQIKDKTEGKAATVGVQTPASQPEYEWVCDVCGDIKNEAPRHVGGKGNVCKECRTKSILPANEQKVEGVKVHPLPEIVPDQVALSAEKTAKAVVARSERQLNRGVARSADETTAVEQEIKGLQKVAEWASGDLWRLNYDVPVGSLPNPSGFLWGYGFRETESVWIMSDRSRKGHWMTDMEKQWTAYNNRPIEGTPEAEGVRLIRTTDKIEWHFSRTHPEEVAFYRDMAQKRIDARLREIHTSLILKLGNAEKALKEAEEQLTQKGTPNWKARSLIQAKRDNAIRAAIRKAAGDLKLASDCAERFDHTDSLRDLMDGLRQVIKAEASSFNVHARAIRVATVNV